MGVFLIGGAPVAPHCPSPPTLRCRHLAVTEMAPPSSLCAPLHPSPSPPACRCRHLAVTEMVLTQLKLLERRARLIAARPGG